MACVERFNTKILEEDEVNLKPIFEEDGINYIYIRHNNLYCHQLSPIFPQSLTFLSLVLGVTKNNADAAMSVLFLYHLVNVWKTFQLLTR